MLVGIANRKAEMLLKQLHEGGKRSSGRRHIEEIKRRADAKQTVNHMLGDDVERDLLNKWQRKC